MMRSSRRKSTEEERRKEQGKLRKKRKIIKINRRACEQYMVRVTMKEQRVERGKRMTSK